jgi:outer membrane beta-barrel protein
MCLFVLLFSFFANAAPAELEQQFGPRPLDGVFVEALQNYSNPRKHHIGFDLGIWPIQPYYNGFSLDFDYSYYFSKDHGWEVLNFSYLYTVDTGLTTELADTYKVDPKSIERVNYIISSNYLLTLAYGKFIFLSDNIRYFRSTLILGPALISSNENSGVGACIGWGFETFVNDRVSWKLTIRDNYAFESSHPNNLVFNIGTSFGY